MLSGWSWLSITSSSISSPPHGRLLSFQLLTSTLPGEHQGWEFIKSFLEVSAAFVNKSLLAGLLNFSLTSCSFCIWKISSYLTSSIFFSYSKLSFVVIFYIVLSLVLWSSDPSVIIRSDASTHPNLCEAVIGVWIFLTVQKIKRSVSYPLKYVVIYNSKVQSNFWVETWMHSVVNGVYPSHTNYNSTSRVLSKRAFGWCFWSQENKNFTPEETN